MATRPLIENDIPQVADLYWNYMREKNGSAPAELLPFFRELYFANPWTDRSVPSYVYEDKSGSILGFLGVSSRKISVNGRPIRAAYGGNFVVHPQARNGLAAPRLLGALIAENHDLLLTDSANERTRSVLQRLNFHTIPALNFHWLRPLRPVHLAAYVGSKALGPLASSARFITKPFCALADAAIGRLKSPFAPPASNLHGAELDVETLAECQVSFREGYSLWPEYDIHSLRWLLGFMNRRRERGDLRKVVLHDDGGDLVGWYIYYVKRGAIGEVVQVGGSSKRFREILRHLFHDALGHGLIALRGVADFRQMTAFSDEGCLFTCRGGWMLARARDPEILSILDRGNGWLSRLDGEWCLDPGE